MSGQGQVKDINAVFTFWTQGWLDGPQSDQNHSEFWYVIRKVTAWLRKSYIKGQGQSQFTKGHKNKSHKYVMQHMFSGPFWVIFLDHVDINNRYQWWWSIDTSSDLTFDRGLFKVRLNKFKFSNRYFGRKHMILAQNFLGISNMSSLLRCMDPQIAFQKMKSQLFAMYCNKNKMKISDWNMHCI